MNSIYEKIQYLVRYLNECTKAYDEGNPLIPDSEWDKMYFELDKLEKETGLILSNSPTQSISYEVVNQLNKIEHEHLMLSLEKTKSIDEVSRFLNHQSFLTMLKMDGLTCSLTYENGELVRAETRGDGAVGEDILHNARVISSIPKNIPIKEKIVIDGEIICRKDDFEVFQEEYKNPRNFAAGSIRLLSAKECAGRKLTFVAWEVIEGLSYISDLSDKLNEIKAFGFTTVPFCAGPIGNSSSMILQIFVDRLTELAEENFYPIDGIVFKFNNIAYGKSQGATDHHFKNAIAYKFYDDLYDTLLLDVEWSMGRTGVLSPVAIFKPVDIDGSTVERASLHNVSVMNETLGEQAHKWQKIKVFKSNMIIPQIAWADKEDHGPLYYEQFPFIFPPDECPVCGGATEERTDNDSTVLVCTNPACPGKLINRLDHFCSKKGLDIKGLSKATLEKLVDWGWIENFIDIFNLSSYRKDWVAKAGFGPKSVDNILATIEDRRNCDLDKFITALGIPLIGSTASKELEKTFPTWKEFITAIESNYRFDNIDGFGYEMNAALHEFDYTEAIKLADEYMIFSEKPIGEAAAAGNKLEGLTFVITGKLVAFKNRDALKALIESHGGKVASSVSKNTSFLINNDINSASSKNREAKQLNIPIITEENFLSNLGEFN